MKSFLSLAGLATCLPAASAHYIFSSLIVNGNTTSDYEYVRKNTNNNSPLMDISSTDFRCNTGAQSSAASTKTYTVAAGSTVGMAVGFGNTIIHPGPLLVYLSKAPEGTTAAEYDGSGDWFKIHQLGTSTINSTGMFWTTTNEKSFTWTLPADTPPGDYLMRTEHIALHQAQSAGGAQYYMECAQLSITGGSASASPSPTAKIPGIYKETDPGVEINIYYPIPQSYTPPGPAVWPAGVDSSGAGSSTGSAVPVSSRGAVAASQVTSNAPAGTNLPATSTAKTISTAGAPVPVAVTAVGATSGSSGTGSSANSAAAPAPAAPAASGTVGTAALVALYGQCGGQSWTGATACAAGTCVSQNAWYYQCIPTAAGANKAQTSVAAVPTTLVTSKKQCTGGEKASRTAGAAAGTGTAGKGAARPSGGAFASGSGSARPSGAGAVNGGKPVATATAV